MVLEQVAQRAAGGVVGDAVAKAASRRPAWRPRSPRGDGVRHASARCRSWRGRRPGGHRAERLADEVAERAAAAGLDEAHRADRVERAHGVAPHAPAPRRQRASSERGSTIGSAVTDE